MEGRILRCKDTNLVAGRKEDITTEIQCGGVDDVRSDQSECSIEWLNRKYKSLNYPIQ